MEVTTIKRTLIQCDFDGTITEEDVAFLILDQYASADWHPWLNLYKKGKISVGDFNTRVFSLVKTDHATLTSFVRMHARLRPGFSELLDYCKLHNTDFVIISNGLDFYIKYILADLGLGDVKIIAAKTKFNPAGMQVEYKGPDGSVLMDSFKEAYTAQYLKEGYSVIYIGNGLSDFPAAKLCNRIFARDELTDCCKKAGISYTPFNDMHDVIIGLNGTH